MLTSNISSRDTSIRQWPVGGCIIWSSWRRTFIFCTRSRLYLGRGESVSLPPECVLLLVFTWLLAVELLTETLLTVLFSREVGLVTLLTIGPVKLLPMAWTEEPFTGAVRPVIFPLLTKTGATLDDEDADVVMTGKTGETGETLVVEGNEVAIADVGDDSEEDCDWSLLRKNQYN